LAHGGRLMKHVGLSLVAAPGLDGGASGEEDVSLVRDVQSVPAPAAPLASGE
jgi:hypothetical protein